jgi:hypothetical protein
MRAIGLAMIAIRRGRPLCRTNSFNQQLPGFVAVERVFQIDSDVSEKNAEVIAEVEMAVLAPFTACSPIASSCTGTCWDLTSNRPKSTPGTRDNFVIGYRLKIEKSFAFQKTDNGSWRCNSTTLQPVEVGLALTGP